MELDEITQHHDVVAAAIVRDDTVLLCHRHPDREWYPNVWDVPGGHIDPGESPIDALVREMREELGIEIDPTRAVSILRLSPKPDLDIEIWAVASWEGDIINTEPAEHDEIRWFIVAELDDIELADAGVATACRLAIERFARQSRPVSALNNPTGSEPGVEHHGPSRTPHSPNGE